MEVVDVLIKNGHVIDPANDVHGVNDVAIKNGKIFAVGESLKLEANDRAATFPGLRKYIIEPSKTRVRCLLHIACHGLAAVGCPSGAPGSESDTLAVLNEEACQKCVEANRDVIVGVKVRLSASICAQGKTEEEAFRRALNVAKKCKVPLMVHHTQSTIPTQSSQDTEKSLCCPTDLRQGDTYTHTYHGYTSTIIDANTGSVWPDVIAARARGVYFDVGHGQGSFSWKVAEMSIKEGFYPDMISTDIHTGNYNGPAYDLPTVMSKFLRLGMPLVDIVRAVTVTPATAFGLSDTIGSLTVGKEADVTILRIEDCDVMMEDSQAQLRHMKQRIVPVAVWRAGLPHPITKPDPWPSIESQRKVVPEWKRLEIRDELEPRP